MFAQQFKQVLSQADHVLEPTYEEPNHINVSHLPQFDHNIHYTLPIDTTTCKVNLRSITPKFQTEYTLPSSTTIFMLKEKILTDPGNFYGADHTLRADNLKLVRGGKVVNNCKTVEEVSTGDLVVYKVSGEVNKVPLSGELYWQTNPVIPSILDKSHDQTKSHDRVHDHPHLKAKPGINDQFWKEIERVCGKYVENVEEILNKFKSQVPNDAEMDLD